jgi:hypothetical protein
MYRYKFRIFLMMTVLNNWEYEEECDRMQSFVVSGIFVGTAVGTIVNNGTELWGCILCCE